MAEVSEPVGLPMYDLMERAEGVWAFLAEFGGDEFERRVTDEIREQMGARGNRVVLWYAERMQDVSAVMEEFGV